MFIIIIIIIIIVVVVVILLRVSFSLQLRLVIFFFSFFFLLIMTRSGLQAGIRWSVSISKSQRNPLDRFITIIFHLVSFVHQRFLIVFHCRLSGSKSSQDSRTLLSILTYPNNKVSKVGDRSRGLPEGSLFNSYYTSFPGLLHFTLDTYLIMLNVKQRGIKYHF